MAPKTGFYIVPTHRWSIERTVWLISGCVLLTATLLAVLVDPLFILGVTATGLVSINVAFTGFCPVGNVLRLFGFSPMLGSGTPRRWNLYFLQTDKWYLERRIYVTVGVNISLGSLLVLYASPWWALFTGFVGAAQGVTNVVLQIRGDLHQQSGAEYEQSCDQIDVAGAREAQGRTHDDGTDRDEQRARADRGRPCVQRARTNRWKTACNGQRSRIEARSLKHV